MQRILFMGIAHAYPHIMPDVFCGMVWLKKDMLIHCNNNTSSSMAQTLMRSPVCKRSVQKSVWLVIDLKGVVPLLGVVVPQSEFG